MDRASDSGSEGWGFESLPVYQKEGHPLGCPSFWLYGKEGTRKIESNSPVGCWAMGRVPSLPYNLFPRGNKLAASPFRCTKKCRYPFGYLVFCYSGEEGTRKIKCNSPGDYCSCPARRAGHLHCRPFPDGNANESLPAYQKNRYPIRDNGFSYMLGGTRKAGPGAAGAKNSPGDCFSGRGRVPWFPDASGTDVDGNQASQNSEK